MSESENIRLDEPTIQSERLLKRRQTIRTKTGIVLVLLLAGLVTWWQLGKYLQLEYLAGADSWLRRRVANDPITSGLAAAMTYIVVTGLSLPLALVLTLLISWLFGFWPALVIISFGSTAGATVAMLASRYVLSNVFREQVSKRFPRAKKDLLENGNWYLATLRLAPPVPFFAVNLLAGLTPIRIRDYWWISQLCMLPATIVYCLAGSGLPDLQTLQIRGLNSLLSRQTVIGLTALALLPLTIRLIANRIRPQSVNAIPPNSADFEDAPMENHQET